MLENLTFKQFAAQFGSKGVANIGCTVKVGLTGDGVEEHLHEDSQMLSITGQVISINLDDKDLRLYRGDKTTSDIESHEYTTFSIIDLESTIPSVFIEE